MIIIMIDELNFFDLVRLIKCKWLIWILDKELDCYCIFV